MSTTPTTTPTASGPQIDPTADVIWLTWADEQPTGADVLRAAASYLERYGWSQGAMFDQMSPAAFPPACTLGAIRIVITGDAYHLLASTHPDYPAVEAAEVVLADYLDPWFHPGRHDAFAVVGIWNDTNGRTITEVITTLREAAYAYEAECYGEAQLGNDRNPTTAGLDAHIRDRARRCATGGGS